MYEEMQNYDDDEEWYCPPDVEGCDMWYENYEMWEEEDMDCMCDPAMDPGCTCDTTCDCDPATDSTCMCDDPNDYYGADDCMPDDPNCMHDDTTCDCDPATDPSCMCNDHDDGCAPGDPNCTHDDTT